MSTAESAPRGRPSSVVWLALAAIAIVLVLTVWRSGKRSDLASHPAIGQRLAYVQLEPLSGEAKSLQVDDLRDKVTLINFWGTWCDICLREMPHLVRLREKFADRDDVQFLFVSCSPDWRPNTPPAIGWSENLQELQSHTADLLARRGWNIPSWSDPRGKTRQAFAGLDAWEGYPTTLLVDREGVIRYVAISYSSGDEYVLEEAIRKLVDSR